MIKAGELPDWSDITWSYALVVKWLDGLRESLPPEANIEIHLTKAGRLTLILDAVEITEHMATVIPPTNTRH